MLARIREHVVRRGTPVQIDFRETERMFPSGTLLFMAEIDRLRQVTGRSTPIWGTYPHNRVVEQVLQQVGILAMLGLKARMSEERFPDNVRHWRATSGQQTTGSTVDPLIQEYDGRLAASRQRDLYDGIVEAMTNCVQHAYEGYRNDELPESMGGRCRSWWMFSQEKDGQLTVALCDLGIGIPVSLADPTKWSQDLVSTLLAKLNVRTPDASRIKVAVELHKTRTREKHRGKGLMEILGVVRKAESGYLSIASNHGVYRYNANSRTEQLWDHGMSIMGTLVQWTLPLPERVQ
jgi:hypothetical protein